MRMANTHDPVLFDEVLAFLQPRPGGFYIDGTVGAGGHTIGILQASAPTGRVLALDRDADALAFTRQRLAELDVHWAQRVLLVQASYTDMGQLAAETGFLDQAGNGVDGVLLDLGLSSRQLDDPRRGFSFQQEGPLDMRFDQQQHPSATDLVNTMPVGELADLFWEFGEEPRSRHYARAIVAARPVKTTTELADIIEQAAGGRRGRRRHPATQVFQALRIAVNAELAALEAGLPAAIELLRPGGRIAVISFHSLEDRFVKQTFRQMSRECICPPDLPVCVCNTTPVLKLVTRKVVKSSTDEQERNPRSRSARLRVAEKLI
jgi:16S rRNA (cytosine1402-N4)-methyltransferase